MIERHADDERNYVKKAVNWAVRQIGKRNRALHKAAVKCAERLVKRDSKSARWIARDALRELRDEKKQKPDKGLGENAEPKLAFTRLNTYMTRAGGRMKRWTTTPGNI